jgi:DNA-directed RNA polymerase subunit M/transcription elongation factor TFIIS
MENFKGSIKAKKKSISVKPKKQENVRIETEEYSHERFLFESVKLFTGFDISPKLLSEMLKNLQIDPSKDLTEDDLFLIYNILTEPLISNMEEKNIYVKKDQEEYMEKLQESSSKFVNVLPNQRINCIYHHLPSLENNRINFEIEKDIFRNKPLLGKGIFKCGKCGSDDTEDYEKQTRSADEPMTVFVHCRNCNAYFRFG